MAIFFISDLHIDAARPDITRQFADFLTGEASGADALYILGDLFESWVGDDAPDAGQDEALEAILAAKRPAARILSCSAGVFASVPVLGFSPIP